MAFFARSFLTKKRDEQKKYGSCSFSHTTVNKLQIITTENRDRSQTVDMVPTSFKLLKKNLAEVDEIITFLTFYSIQTPQRSWSLFFEF